MAEQTHRIFTLLDLDNSASPEEVRRKWKQINLKLHPDKGASEDDVNKLKEINGAYDDYKRSIPEPSDDQHDENVDSDAQKQDDTTHEPDDKKDSKGPPKDKSNTDKKDDASDDPPKDNSGKSDTDKKDDDGDQEVISAPDLDPTATTIDQGDKPGTPKLKPPEDHGVEDTTVPNMGGSSTNQDLYIQDLNYDQGKKLIEVSRLLWGFSLKSDGAIDPLSYPIFELTEEKEFDLSSHFIQETHGSSSTFMSYTSVHHQLITNGFSTVEAGISGAYNGVCVKAEVSAQMKINKQDENFHEKTKESSTLIAEACYPRGVISLDERCLILTKDFQNDLVAYVDGKMDEEEFRRRYGYWVTLKATVGGMAYCSRTVDYTQEKTEEKRKSEYSAAFSTKVSSVFGGVNANAKFGIGDGKAVSDEEAKKVSTMTLYSKGGNNTAITQDNWSKWAESIDTNPAHWAVVNVDETKDVLELERFMPPKYREAISSDLKKKREEIKKSPPKAETATEISKLRRIRSKATGKYLTTGTTGKDQSYIMVFDPMPEAKDLLQLFHLMKTDYGVAIKEANRPEKSARVLQFNGDSEWLTPGDPGRFRNTTNELFQFVDLGDRSYRIDVGNGNEDDPCLDVSLRRTKNRIGKEKKHGGDNQIWYLENSDWKKVSLGF
eukprot:184570_1